MPSKSNRHLSYLPVLAVCVAGIASAAGPVTPTTANSYLVHNLVSDLPTIADYQDPNLVNPWGMSSTSSSPFWVSNNGTGTSTLYTTTGAPVALVVTIPTPTGAKGGAVTGQIANTNTAAFPVATGKAASFIFCTEDGTISGWNSTVNATQAIVTVDNSKAGAIFKGCVAGGTTAAPIIYAADFHNGVVDMFDLNFKPITPASGAFVDPTLPAGYAPFGIANFGGKIYVTYAKQDAAKKDDVAGIGNGFVDVYDAAGTLQTHLVSAGALNSPWGMQMAPANFGAFAGALLVGNFGDGTINAYDPTKGTSLGALKDPTGHTLTITGLWGLLFGNGGRGGDTTSLYFTAGIPGPYGEDVESHGLFGSIQPSPMFTTAVNGASFQAGLAPNTWGTITGGALATTARSWAATDFSGANLPTVIDDVSVLINGTAAPISYVGPSQINFLVPNNAATGATPIQVNNNGQISAAVNVTINSTAPAFFWFTGNKYIAATHANGTLIGPTTLIPGATTQASPGEIIVLYGTGFGGTSPAPPNNQTFVAPLALATLPTVTIGGTQAVVTYGGMIEPGVYQINVTVPTTLPAGDAAVIATAGGQQSQANAFISVL
jgi:uncharacterized protein (TIGR03118 family)